MNAPFRQQPSKKPFSWSWSRLKNFRTCPKRHYEIDIAKRVREPESEQLKWGNQVHDAMAARIAKGTPLPKIMTHYDEWPTNIVAAKDNGAIVLVENKMAMTESFTPSSFFDAATWFRGVLDVIMLYPAKRAAVVIDWKTGGKIAPDLEQLGLFAQLVFAHHPDIDEVATYYVWLGHDQETLRRYRRDGMIELWSDVLPLVKVMRQAFDTTTYPANPSGLCIRYCPVTSCPHHGVGTR